MLHGDFLSIHSDHPLDQSLSMIHTQDKYRWSQVARGKDRLRLKVLCFISLRT